jgi:hypothetical protein
MIPTNLVLDLISAFKKNDENKIDDSFKKIMKITEEK